MPGAATRPDPPGSYSVLELVALAPVRKCGSWLVSPLIRVLAYARVPPNVLSLSQVPLGFTAAALIEPSPRIALGGFALAVFFDFLDGELARHTNSASRTGALVDQISDHMREITVIGGLAVVGALRIDIAVAYALAYPISNFLLYVAHRVRQPIRCSIKTWISFYPLLLAFLWFGWNALDFAGCIAVGLMLVSSVYALRNIRASVAEVGNQSDPSGA